MATRLLSRGLFLRPLGAAAAITAAAAGINWSALATAPSPASAVASASPPEAAAAPPSAVFTRAEVSRHAGPESVWVTFEGGVYDVSSFVRLHPGGAKILFAAGGALEPYWRVYAQHSAPGVREILERYRIGSLDAAEAAAEAAARAAAAAAAGSSGDPYAGDPARSPLLAVRNARPFNAEPPAGLLVDSYITPTELLFVRNHLPVPALEAASFALRVEGGGGGAPTLLSLADLRARFPRREVTAVLSCAGNRRRAMSEDDAARPARGLAWGTAAIGNVAWAGAPLRDVLLAAGVRDEDVGRFVRHIVFEGLDADPSSGGGYGASIPADAAMDPAREVLLAYEMNGQPLGADHGGPLRVVVPGVVGARQVKWLGTVRASPAESDSLWQAKDYRVFPPGIDAESVDFSRSDIAPPIQEMPVTSAICEPAPGEALAPGATSAAVRGYAWSGGGRAIARVDVSADGGASWVTAEVTHAPEDASPSRTRSWGWTLWSAEVPLPQPAATQEEPPAPRTLELICKAVDVAHNTQPERIAPHWNYRGLLNNAWHRVEVKVPAGLK